MTLPETAERRPLYTDGAPDTYSPDATIPDPADVARLLAISRERDLALRVRLAWARWMYRLGFMAGVDHGRRQAEAEQARSWYAIAHPVAIGGIPHAELERRRWGPGGRGRFGDPRPGDYPGRGGAAA